MAHLARLARLAPEEGTLAKFGEQCADIIAYMDILAEVAAMLGKSFFSFLKLCLFCTIHKDKIAARKKINHLRAFFYPCFYAYKNKCFNDRAFHD